MQREDRFGSRLAADAELAVRHAKERGAVENAAIGKCRDLLTLEKPVSPG